MKNNQKGFTTAELLMTISAIGVMLVLTLTICMNLIEQSRDAATIAELQSAYQEAQLVQQNHQSTKDGHAIFVSYQDKVGDDGKTKSMVVIRDFIAKGKNDNSFTELTEDISFKDVFHETMAKLDDGSGESYVIEFKYDQAGKLYLVQAFDQESYNEEILE
ncbi:hypothetical protein SAMN05421767_1154 [Granulicatella balaenopterae]|uniref:Prepilin-type N-terminal cleavage/methylation domain-containing protein n=1 Tax=Granulicatella balaenopterae TaxID=137733 RepID=A0A1H9KR17_9LACT|nr:hypothetical protein [Granulicatella balaenopterae]SER01283.1 hypothetical protein SAMN05421767_1154 [Granulicatella balaenopterae]